VTASRDIDRAVDALRRGLLVAFPTETVYGLGADARSPEALARLYAAKGRPSTHPVIVHLAHPSQVADWAAGVSPAARAVTEAFWPGPLTVVVRRAPHVLDAVTGGEPTVGLRAPDQPLALELLAAFGDGLAAPSANRFGRVSPTTASDVFADLGDAVEVVLDGGPCRVGVESTIVDCSRDGLTILRPGAISREAIEGVTGVDVRSARDVGVRAPGTLKSHYAPRATVLLVSPDELERRARELVDAGQSVAVLALSEVFGVADPRMARLSDAKTRDVVGVTILDAPRDVDEYARVLYARLREVDARSIDVLLAVPPPESGIGVAVFDRLRRASGREGT
jgi:L-threonylcarbamoyladenylate synthase